MLCWLSWSCKVEHCWRRNLAQICWITLAFRQKDKWPQTKSATGFGPTLTTCCLCTRGDTASVRLNNPFAEYWSQDNWICWLKTAGQSSPILSETGQNVLTKFSAYGQNKSNKIRVISSLKVCSQIQWVHLAHKFASLHVCCHTGAFTTAHGTQHMCTMFCIFSLGSVSVAFTSSIVCPSRHA